ncbi:MAG: tetratricopeptide repeat protein [Planctomycetota bacterium]|nr:tetratricopeptide repeat protein [Planctomycetota bacterium]
MGPTISPSSQAVNPRPDRRVTWEWNMKLLTIAVVSIIVVSSIGGVSYWLQSERIAASMLTKAKEAKEAGDYKEHAKWLKRYVALVPSNTEAMYEFAVSLDDQVKDGPSLLRARKYLSSAIGTLGNSVEDNKKRDELRRRLIQRLVLLGGIWASEAERQIILLDPDPNDSEAMIWLAKSLAAQRRASVYQIRNPGKFDKREDFWNWQANQTTGDVLLAAYEANRDDAMVGRLLTSICLDNPEWFDSPDGQADRSRLEKIASQTANMLSEYIENSEAQYAAIAYYLDRNKARAEALLKEATPRALARVEAITEQLEEQQEDEKDNSLLPTDGPLTQFELYWSWQLVLTDGYQKIQNNDYTAARDILAQLVDLDGNQVPRQLRESTYGLLTETQLQQEDTKPAIETLKKGLAAISESRTLLRMLAETYIGSQDTLADARETIELYSTTISNQMNRLNGTEGANFTTSQRETLRNELKLADWQSQVLQGRLLILEKRLPEATGVLRRCFESKLPLSNPQRVNVGGFLANVYSLQQLFDLAGETLDTCISMDPENRELREASTDCWMRAGFMTRAAQVGESLDDGSFASAIQAARLSATLEASKPIGESNTYAVKQKLAEARKRLEASDDPEIKKQAWQVAMFEALMPNYERQVRRREKQQRAPSEEETAQAIAEKARMSATLKELGEQYPDSADLQSRLVSIFSRERDFETAKVALDRLEKLPEDTAANLTLVKVLSNARYQAAQQDIDAAINFIREGMESADRDEALILAQSGANLAIQSKRGLDAFELLNAVPEAEDGRPSVKLLVQIATLATALQADSNYPDFEFDFEGCIKELKDIEGEEGSHWRFVEIQQLLAKADRAAAENKNPGKILEQAADSLRTVLISRPRWGLAAALGGDVSRRQGFSREAIRYYNRAIRNGDQSIRTRLKLAEVFLSTGKTEEAEQLIQQMAGVSEDVIALDSLSASLAERQGDYLEALRYAELSAAKRKGDTGPLLVISRLNNLMAAQTPDKNLEAEYRAAAKKALDEAEKLVNASNSSRQWLMVKSRRLAAHFANDDRAAIEAEIDQIISSDKAPIEERLLMAGKTYFGLGEFAETQKYVDRLLQLDRKNAEAYLLLYRLHMRLGDNEKAIGALRSANRAYPDNTVIAENLALTLAINSEDEAPWEEIDRLLTRDEATSTTQTKLLRAQIALIKGNAARQKEAATELTKLSERTDAAGVNAKRLLARHFASLWQRDALDVKSPKTIEYFQRSSSIQQEILRSPEATPDDYAKYVQLLTAAGFARYQKDQEREANDLVEKAERAIRALEEQSGSSMASLRLEIRLNQLKAELEGNPEMAAELAAKAAKKWIDNIGELESFGEQKVWAIAGKTLVDMGFATQSLVWLERIYQADPSQYKLLVIGLTQAKKYDRALALCTENYARKPDAGVAALISEIALLDHKRELPQGAQDILDNALKVHPNTPLLYESLATLELMRKNYDRAIELYEAAIRSLEDKNSIRVLNNLAIALSRSRTRKPEALRKINHAIDNFGRNPELIDTKGSVHQALGQFKEAEKAFEEATLLSNNPTFRIHLVNVQLESDDLAGARKNWNKIPHGRLKRMSMTEDDIELYETLKKKLEAKGSK